MKICYLGDASSVHIKKWVDFFARKGHEILVISLKQAHLDQARVYSFEEEGFFERTDLQKLGHYLQYIQKIRQIIRKERPDIVHAHYATSYGLYAALAGIHPYFLSVWGSDIYQFPKKSWIHRALLTFNLKKADQIFSTSQDMKREAQAYTNKPILVTPFGVDTSFYRPSQVRKEGAFTLGTIKSFYSYYGIDDLIRAFELFLDQVQDPSVRLLLAGQGDQEAKLRQMVADKGLVQQVDFLGQLSRPEVVATFQDMDVAVFPSLSESFGVSAVEAQACGATVIVSQVGGLPEVVEDGVTGRVVPPRSPEKIAQELVYLYQHPQVLVERQEAAVEFIRRTYDLEENFKDIEKIYQTNQIHW